MSFFSVLVLCALMVGIYLLIYPGRIAAVLAPDSTFQWENFYPLSREPGLWGISPLIWTALVVLPVCIGIPTLIYLKEKKKVAGITRVFLALTRACVLLLLYLLIAGPSLVDAERYTEGSKVAVLIDDSLSMGDDAREFPIFNVFDDRESSEVRDLRDHLRGLGIDVANPPAQGYVTLTPDELAVRNFVRRVVRERSSRLVARLAQLHGARFDIGAWQRLRRELDTISAQADLKQSELAAETAKETPDDARVRRLQGDLDDLLKQLTTREAEFARLLGGSVDDESIKRKRALVNNLLATAHAEGPRRWDIATELVTQGNTLGGLSPGEQSLIDVLHARAAEIEAKADRRSARQRVPMMRYFVFSTRFGRDQLTDEAILEIDPADLDFREPRGRLSEIETALREVRRYYTVEDDLSAVIVLSDGRDTSASEERPADEARGRGGVEVVTVAVGNPKPVKVLELLSVSADREILKGDVLDFKLKIRADKAYRADPESGKPGQRVKIILCEDSPTNPVPYSHLNGREVRGTDGMEVELGPEELAEVRVRFKPSVTGKHVYYLKLNEDRLPDEDTYRNNVKEHEVEIIDRRIKLLYLEGRFRYQARYLNEALKRDKKLEYQAFFFDAHDGWTQPISNDPELRGKVEPLVGPFSNNGRLIRDKEEFFKLDYDVIMIGDIDPDDSRFRREHWDWLEEWVSHHRGGLILLAGQGHNPRGYSNIEKARVLYPVEIEGPRSAEGEIDVRLEKFWRLTPAGRAHEVHRLSPNSARNDELWGSVRDAAYVKGQLHGLYWYHRTGGIKPAPAVALSRVVREGRITGEGDVLTAAMPYGSGMTFYVGSDDTWLWREFFGDLYFYRFWQNATRFVASRRLKGKQQRVDVYTDKTRYQVSEQVKVYVELLGDIYNEVTQNQNKELSELPRGPDDAETRRLIVELQARAQGRLTARRVTLSEVSWSPNLFEGVVEANEPGQFDVWVAGYEESRKAPHRYTVVAPVAELRNLAIDLEAMQRRATRLPPGVAPLEYQAGKRVYLMTDMGRAIVDVREKEHEVKGMTALLWNRSNEPWSLRSILLVLLIMLLAGEWLTRKMSRMV
ncbi:MAG: VWA domain-containing protein [Planctomycetes bacterium]|nr:VWA domain-containing protein [Planctomycetota bacterium]MCW8134930.1 VWA domain-containing protein [Planctomycetota bacterium]